MNVSTVAAHKAIMATRVSQTWKTDKLDYVSVREMTYGAAPAEGDVGARVFEQLVADEGNEYNVGDKGDSEEEGCYGGECEGKCWNEV
jgi:hypothetical protein